ncbi:MAG: DUF4402 domain-containing protein [Mariniphaga sp.]
MKKSFLLFAAIVMILSFSTNVMAQTSAKVSGTTAGAQLIVPMTLTETSPLHFGTINLLAAAGGDVILSTAGVRSFDAGLAASLVAPLATNAAYNVTGTYNETYALTLPPTIEVKETVGGTATMTISALKAKFNATGADAVTSTLNGSGAGNFKVGGTLTVAASQLGGIYAGTFDVSVDYN